MDKRWNELFLKRGKCSNPITKKYLDDFGFKKNFDIIHVVGTNGKGSVASYIAQGLINSGKNVGLFTSPHLMKPNERITINGIEINDYDFFDIYEKIKKKLEINFFPIIYIVAMLWFQKNKVDIVILEAGIGARFDPTIIYRGKIGVVTSLGLDHTDWFGNNLNDIAKDKAGFMTKNMNVFFSQDLIKKEVFLNEAIKVGANINEVKLVGNYHERNSLLANKVLDKEFNIKMNKFEKLPGRTEYLINNGHRTIFDVAHNKFGFIESLKEIKYNYKQVVISLSKTKNKDGIINFFKDKDIFVYQVDKTFYSANDFLANEITDLKKFYKTQNKSTLYIGSFKLIGKIHE